jgi:hypothetical protein
MWRIKVNLDTDLGLVDKDTEYIFYSSKKQQKKKQKPDNAQQRY